jgi:chromosome partitioning protein
MLLCGYVEMGLWAYAHMARLLSRVTFGGSVRVLSIVSTKGGVGKTTLALHLAVAAHAGGEAVLILDLDDPQLSAMQWWKDRQRTITERNLSNGAPFDVRPAAAKDLAGLVDAAEGQGFDLVVIDTPPHADYPAARAIEVADLVLMPVRPSSLDLHAAKATIALVRELDKRAFFVVNQLPHNSQTIGLDASDFLETKGIKRGPLPITTLQPFVRCMRDGLTAQEVTPDGRAANEIGDLWRWTHVQLDVARMLRERAPAPKVSRKGPSALLGDPFAELELPPVGEGAA